ncbi:Protein DSE1 [Spathaspora sp. JA1]|nr:Protein DSE1 [Spathaspora sp. JA1]
MTDYYTPSLLFRQNAIRRYQPSLSPISSETNLTSISSSSTKSNWLLNLDNPKDCQILNQSCLLDNVNIKSNYWKIPDTNMNLTSLAISPNSANTITPTLAIGSGNREANLFIYQLNMDDNNLTHHCTITLPNIHTMQWVNSKYMITGNNKGYGHLVSIPSVTDAEINEEEAEICKRFNHRKHLRNHPDKYKSNAITKLQINCEEQLISLYNNHLFQWDIKGSETQAKPVPISITNIAGISDIDTTSTSSSTMAISGKFGVSLFDFRDGKFRVPEYVLPNSFEKFQRLNSNLIRWNDQDNNILASGHGDGVVRLWDVRKINNCIASLCSNTSASQTPTITTLQWNNGDIFTGSQDGNIIHWDLTTSSAISTDQHTTCTLSQGLNSAHFNGRSNSLESIAQQRQCGTILPASNTNIVGMTSIQYEQEQPVVVSIDGSSFLGVHAKVTDTQQEYYTNLYDFDSHISEDTLVDIPSEQPLRIREKRITSSEPMIPLGMMNESVDTLQEHEQIQAKQEKQKEVIVIEDEVDDDEFHFLGNNSLETCCSVSSSSSDMDSPNSVDSVNSFSTLATDVGCEYDKTTNDNNLELMFKGIFDALV